MDGSSIERPHPYSDTMDFPLISPTFQSNDQIIINYVYTIYKQVWDSTGAQYVQTDCNITIETSVTLSWSTEQEQYVLPDNWATQTTNGFLVKKYFQELINSDSQYCSKFNTTDDSDKPDVFYTAIDVDAGDGNTYEGEMYVSLDDRDAEDLARDETAYGYALSGKGGDGASGSIYDGVDMYGGTGDEGGFGNLFSILFLYYQEQK